MTCNEFRALTSINLLLATRAETSAAIKHAMECPTCMAELDAESEAFDAKATPKDKIKIRAIVDEGMRRYEAESKYDPEVEF